jgi:DNA-binding CsgD family transcriptional regulator
MKDRYNVFNPTTLFLRQNIGIKQCTLTEQLRYVPPHVKSVYRERFMSFEGWDKYAEIYFWGGHQLQAVVCVRKAPEHGNFGTSELGFLSNLQRRLTPIVRRIHRQLQILAAAKARHRVMRELPLPLVMLDWSFRPCCFNFEARRLCVEWTQGEIMARSSKAPATTALPIEILEALIAFKKSLLSSATGSRAHRRRSPRIANVCSPVQPGMGAQIEMINDRTASPARPHFLVRLYKHPPTPSNTTQGPNVDDLTRKDFSASSLASCLSRCERDVARLVCQGLSNLQIAMRLYKSEATVKMQLRSIFCKLEVCNRTQLANLLNRSWVSAAGTGR